MLTLQEISYLYGLFITDGYLCQGSKNTTYLKIELQEKDKELLYKIYDKCKGHINQRTRDTNFKTNYISTTLTITDTDVLKAIFDMDFPLEDKTNNARPPKGEYSKKDFWRGVIDGDGSLGIRKNGPYLSLTTKSEALKEAFVDLVQELTGFKMNVHRNKRDNIYNLTICSQKAKTVADWLYGEMPEFQLLRKYNKYCEMFNKEPKELDISTLPTIEEKSRSTYRKWTNEEIEYLKTHTKQESVEYLDRTKKAIELKRYQLKLKGEI